MPDDTMEFSCGQIVGGRYLILRAIGRGGSGTVYCVRDLRLKKVWAMKLIRNSGMGQKICALELSRMKNLNHPAIPRVVDTFETGEGKCIIMDFLKGRTLDQIRGEDGEEILKVSRQQLIQWGIELCDVLDYLHHCRPPVIYRDMKPGNILLRPDGTVMLLDFGTPGEMGTPGYAAPEQLERAGFADERSDIYSLGRTLYRLYRSEKIFPKRTFGDRKFLHILKKACEKNPEKRFQSALAMKKMLERAGSKPVPYGIKRQTAVSCVVCLAVLFFILSPAVGQENAASAASSGEYAAERTAGTEHQETRSASETEGSDGTGDGGEDNGNETVVFEQAEHYRKLAEECAETNPQQAICFLEEACRCLKGVSGKEDLLYDCELRIFRLLLSAKAGEVNGQDSEIDGCFQRLRELDPSRSEPYLMYISYEYRNGRLTEAADLFRKASEVEGVEADPGYRSLEIKLTNAGAISENGQ